MKEVLVYFEGPSDIAAMEVLFGNLIAGKASEGTFIKLLKAGAGDRKQTLLTKTPIKAARVLQNNPQAIVVIVPDLYPPNKGFPHRTFEEMQKGSLDIFISECERIAAESADGLLERFNVFCFKHDLESLLLACPDALKDRLGADQLKVAWANPVEDQNHDDPPKAVVKRLFAAHGQRYDEVADAPFILAGTGYHALAQACPQSFKPFADFLERL